MRYFQRKIITAKDTTKKEEVTNKKVRIEKTVDNEIDEFEYEEDQELTREDLLSLITETKEEQETAEAEISSKIEDDTIEDLNEDELEDVDAENTWKMHLEKILEPNDQAGSLILKRTPCRFPFYRNSNFFRRNENDSVSIYENVEDLHIKLRILRNMKKMDQRGKELFSVIHQYKDLICTNTTRKTTSAYLLHVLNHITKGDTFNRNNSNKLAQMDDTEKAKVDIRDKQIIRPKVRNTFIIWAL